MIDLRREGDVFVLHMDNGENRFNADSVDAIHAALDELDAQPGPRALVTVGEDKFFSNGLDLDWMMDEARPTSPNFMDGVHRIFGRILFNEAPTAAAINGHAFAGGAMLAMAHDHRVMRNDRGYFCIPEVDLGLPLSPGMSATLAARMPATVLHRAVVTGRRWNAEEMVANHIAEDQVPGTEVLATALAWATEQAHHAGEPLGIMKRQLYPAALEILGNG
jgi:enoyl-CoA hydratase/carnithine racemase